MMVSLVHNFLLGGVNHSIPGNGGIDCVNYLPTWQKVLETAVLVPLSMYGMYWAMGSLEFPEEEPIKNGGIKIEIIQKSNGHNQPSNGAAKIGETSHDSEIEVSIQATRVKPLRDYLFRIYLGIFIVELIYKIVSRFHMYTMPGAILALLFPILNTRLLPGEVVIYYIQHFFIVFIPLFLMLHEESFVPESANNIAWPAFSFCIILLYHYLLLQPLGLLTHVNLNCILCPAVSDPFASRLWRIAGIFHQGVLTPVVTKLYSLLGLWLLADTKQHVIESSMHVAKKMI